MPKGQIVSFDNRKLRGWVEEGAKVDVFLNDQLARLEVRYSPSRNPGFDSIVIDFEIDPRLAPTPKIVVKFAGTDSRVPVSPAASGFVNRVEFSEIERGLPTYMANMAHLPVPPDDYILSNGCQTFINLLYFGMLAGKNRRLLDLGCGCGRMALPLAPYLAAATHEYVGYDTWRNGIVWARENISVPYPHMRFEWLPQEDQSKRRGYQADQVFSLTEPDESIDGVFATSLFTHLRMPAVVGYLKEIFRILRPGGRAYLTWFLVTKDDDWAIEHPRVNERTDDGAYVVADTYVDAFLYENRVFDAIEALGFRTMIKEYGVWGHRPRTGLSREGQDLLLLVKPERVTP
jgi:SAM-dependent methyltransferase